MQLISVGSGLLYLSRGEGFTLTTLKRCSYNRCELLDLVSFSCSGITLLLLFSNVLVGRFALFSGFSFFELFRLLLFALVRQSLTVFYHLG